MNNKFLIRKVLKKNKEIIDDNPNQEHYISGDFLQFFPSKKQEISLYICDDNEIDNIVTAISLGGNNLQESFYIQIPINEEIIDNLENKYCFGYSEGDSCWANINKKHYHLKKITGNILAEFSKDIIQIYKKNGGEFKHIKEAKIVKIYNTYKDEIDETLINDSMKISIEKHQTKEITNKNKI